MSVGQTKAAEAEFIHAKELDSYNADADLGLQKVAAFEPVVEKEYDPEVAERRIQIVLQQKPNDTHALAFLGDVYTSVDPQKASEYYDEAIASDKKNAWAYYGKGILEEGRGNINAALQMYEAAITISPWNQSFLNNAAYEYYLQRNYEKAEKLYVRLLNLQTNFLISYSILANTEWLLGNVDLADRNLEPLDEKLRDPSILKLRFNRGRWGYHIIDQSDLFYLYSPQEKTVYLRYLLALARQLAGHPEGARGELQEAVIESRDIDTSRARQILNSDISNLEKARPELAERLRKFRLPIRR